jgi:DMSO/TMAO reductase YedYZ molybdopterin-dependent catalytic subunit
VLGLALLIALPLVIFTGLLDYIAYAPRFGQAQPVHVGWLRLPYVDWPTRPSWLFRLTQGLHVVLGLTIIPIVLGKLWSVIPKLFEWPPVKSPAQAIERISLALLVGGILFEIATGVLNIQYDYVFGFNFYTAHYYGAWVFIAAFVVHVALKLPVMRRGLASRSFRREMRTPVTETRPEARADDNGLVAVSPDAPTMSRRGALALVGGGSLLLLVLSAGQTLGGPVRSLALLLPRGRSYGEGPNAFQVNKTAFAAGIDPRRTGAGWRLALIGPGGMQVRLSRTALLAMPQHTATLPIACVEGWSTTQTWTGVRLADLATLARCADPAWAHVASLQSGGSFNEATLQANQVLAGDALLALRVNGADLSLDHGYPARIIVPALPGVHNTKWVRAITFGRE